MNKTLILKRLFWLTVLSYLFFMLGNGLISLTNPDEVFYAQTAREMIQHHTWMVPYLFGHPQFEKPIMLYWLLRAGFAMFGVSNFSARFFPAVFGLLGIAAVYLMAFLGFRNEKKARFCALVMMSSALYIGLARTVFTDLIFSVFILFSFLSFYYGYTTPGRRGLGIVLAFGFSGLAVLTKGPLGLWLPGAGVFLFLMVRNDLKCLLSRSFLWGLALFFAIVLPWYLYIDGKFGSAFTNEFFYNDHLRRLLFAEHRNHDKWYTYPGAMIFCMFPWSLFTLAAFLALPRRLKNQTGQLGPIYPFLAWWIFAVFVTFQIAHSKLVSYIFPLFPALAIMTGDFIYEGLRAGKRSVIALIRAQWVLLALIIPALIIAALKYPHYVPSLTYVLWTAAADGVLLAVMLGLMLRKKFQAALSVSAFQIPLLLAFALMAHASFDAYVSSKAACRYLTGHEKVNTTILCSKFFVRGVRYYTDKSTAVIDINGKGFFSAHPIPYLNSDAKVGDFLRSQPVTYGILKRSSVDDMKRIAHAYGFTMKILAREGDEFVVRILPKGTKAATTNAR